MAFSTSPLIGINTNQTFPAGAVPPFNLGLQAFGNDGKLYVFAQASGAISADDADCSVNATTFAATNSGGSYKAPNVAMASGEFGWFGKASV